MSDPFFGYEDPTADDWRYDYLRRRNGTDQFRYPCPCHAKRYDAEEDDQP